MDNSFYKDISASLLRLSEDNIDDSMKSLIRKWSDPPKALEILEVLDKCIYSSLGSGFVVTCLQ